ncbi:MAG: hypothetical protein PHG99_07685 [Erysipelotrichaceae bacterium]|nr:hypothetical protein [Erysipelotrichaceae bacterium]
MKDKEISSKEVELNELSLLIKNNYYLEKTQEYKAMIYEIMGKFPHPPQPHNLLGLLFEKEGNHIMAMKHFRAAYALDPTYLPVRHNLDKFGNFYNSGSCAFDESDCMQENSLINDIGLSGKALNVRSK